MRSWVPSPARMMKSGGGWWVARYRVSKQLLCVGSSTNINISNLCRCIYRDRLKSEHQVWWILLLQLPNTSAPACLRHSRNLEHRLEPISLCENGYVDKNILMTSKISPVNRISNGAIAPFKTDISNICTIFDEHWQNLVVWYQWFNGDFVRNRHAPFREQQRYLPR